MSEVGKYNQVSTTLLNVVQRFSCLYRHSFQCLQQTKDPQLQFSLGSYSNIFAVTAAGIRRYLILVQPLDRETQDSYTFTVFSRLCI